MMGLVQWLQPRYVVLAVIELSLDLLVRAGLSNAA